jgi:competence protein ComEA
MLRGGLRTLAVVFASAVFAASPSLADGPQNDRGRELFEDVCVYCHALSKVSGHHLNREEWKDLTKGMISEGAPVTDEEFSLILDYLAKNFGREPEK